MGDALTGEIVKANRDFRGYRDLVSYFAKEFNPAGDPAIERKIVDYVEEWLASQLVEAVMTVRNLVNGRTGLRAKARKSLRRTLLLDILLDHRQRCAAP